MKQEKPLCTIFRDAAREIRARGWTQGTRMDVDGHVDLTAALAIAETGNPWRGPSRRVLCALEHLCSGYSLSNWNDRFAQSEDDVIAALNAAANWELL